ncbi:MAG: hypothetical protein JXA42_09170 [Anaerolineales bacterium]|nr:hypothetical protein [Anaerolineales bacterium]
MKPRDRILAVLEHRIPDRVPRFEIWIEKEVVGELGQGDLADTHANLGQDSIMMPTQTPDDTNYWRDGIDHLGQVWQGGTYVDGVVDTDEDLVRYSPPLEYARAFFDREIIQSARDRYPDHLLFYGTHNGPFTAGYMAMGFERFFVRLADDPAFIHRLLAARTGWCIAVYQKAIELGAELIILGDDAAHNTGPMISPRMWRQFILPYHKQIVESLEVPVIWHSDGNIEKLLPMAVEAGFAGIHSIEPTAGMDLERFKQEFGRDLAAVGNLDVNVLFDADLEAVRREVDRCMRQGAPGGRYMFSSCNSIFEGMNADAVLEMFRYEAEVGRYT